MVSIISVFLSFALSSIPNRSAGGVELSVLNRVGDFENWKNEVHLRRDPSCPSYLENVEVTGLLVEGVEVATGMLQMGEAIFFQISVWMLLQPRLIGGSPVP
jgi:hypothetical protein